MAEEATTKKRQRAGTWTRFQKTTEIEGIMGPCVVNLINVQYGEKTWEIADTKEGRKLAAHGIREEQIKEAKIRREQRAKKARLIQLEKAKDLIQKTCADLSGEEVGMAMASLMDLIAWIRGDNG